MDMRTLREKVLTISTNAKEGHIPSALSVLDLIWVLYDRILKVDPTHTQWSVRDRFVLSKGHAAIGLYVVLAQKGFFPASELENFAKFDSILGGHPDRNKIPGVEASTGSLGHGFPLSVGMALGLKMKKFASRVFVIIGDGEANEGAVWESALLASHHNLTNLCCIVDYNHSTDRALQIGDMGKKLNSFGWETCSIDGHNHDEIFDALQKHGGQKPRAIIANTIKGFGCTQMENNPEWHHKYPKHEELLSLLKGLR
ncbi:MAG: transketolase [Bacteroidota bacterium]